MIIMMGLAGSGKSSQSELLSKELNCPWVGVGNLLRKYMDAEQQKIMLTGELLDDSITLGVLDKEFEAIDAAHNEFILDGFPRSMRQAKWLLEKITAGQLNVTAIIHLVDDKQNARNRLLKRGRSDDIPEAIDARFHEYDLSIMPIIELFTSEGLTVTDIDARQDINSVNKAILSAINRN